MSLEFVTTKEIVDELQKRCFAGLIAMSYAHNDDEEFIWASWGSRFWRAGAAEWVQKATSADVDELMLEGGEE